MKYDSINTIQNDPQTPSIVIRINDANWNEAYNNWLNGKNPTDSKEWKKGIIAFCDAQLAAELYGYKYDGPNLYVREICEKHCVDRLA